MFKDGLKNMAWGLSQQWIGGSQVMWLQEHVVLHHMHTGDVHMDPDAQMAPAMRGTIPASRRVEAPSRHRRDSFPGMMDVGGLFFDFGAIRTETAMLRAGCRSSRTTSKN